MIKRLIGSKIARNASWIVLCRIMQSVISMVISIITARYLGPSNYGVINYAASLAAFVAPLMYLGLNSTLVQELVQNPEQDGKIMGTSITMSVTAALLCIVGIGAFTAIANPSETETLIVCLLYSTLLIFQAIDLLRYWFLSKYMSKVSSIAMLVSYMVAALYKVVLLISGQSVVWFAITNSLEYMLIAIILVIMYFKKGGGRFSFSWKMGKRLLKKSSYYILSNLMVALFLQSGKIIIKTVMDDAATGYYSAGVAIITMSSFVFQAIVDSFRPEVLKQTDPVKIENNMIKVYALVMYLALAQAIVLCVFAKPIVTLIYGQGYAPATIVLQIGIWQTVFSYLAYARDIWILATGKQKYLWIINLAGACTNILLNLLLIPLFGLIGAAITAVVTEFVANILVCQIIKPVRRNNLLMLKAMNITKVVSLFKN